MQYIFTRRIQLVQHKETSCRAKCICSVPSACTYSRVRSNKLLLWLQRPLLVSYHIYSSVMLPLGTKGNIEVLAERYILLDSLLFKLNTIPEKEKALLAIPEVCADQIVTLYHSCLLLVTKV